MRLWGFNTVLVSGADDAEGLMLVDPAASQIEAEDGVVHLVMCHHPFGWLKNKWAFEDRLSFRVSAASGIISAARSGKEAVNLKAHARD